MAIFRARATTAMDEQPVTTFTFAVPGGGLCLFPALASANSFTLFSQSLVTLIWFTIFSLLWRTWFLRFQIASRVRTIFKVPLREKLDKEGLSLCSWSGGSSTNLIISVLLNMFRVSVLKLQLHPYQMTLALL